MFFEKQVIVTSMKENYGEFMGYETTRRRRLKSYAFKWKLLLKKKNFILNRKIT